MLSRYLISCYFRTSYYCIAFSSLNSSTVTVGGISPRFILSITSRATLPAVALPVNPLLPGIPGMEG